MGLFSRDRRGASAVPSPIDLVMGEFDGQVREQDEIRSDVENAMHNLDPLIVKALQYLASDMANGYKSWRCTFKVRSAASKGQVQCLVGATSYSGVTIDFWGCGYAVGNAIRDWIDLRYGATGHGYTVTGGRSSDDPHWHCYVSIRQH